MRFPKLLLVICCFYPVLAFAQSDATIEADLLKLFKRIDYWSQNKGYNSDDSLSAANNVFQEKIKYYTGKFPSTLTASFSQLKKARLDIFSSSDKLFRIYSWDTWTGGTMHQFAGVMQYQTGTVVKSILLTPNDDDGFYSALYTFKANRKTYYLVVYNAIYSTKDCGAGIQVIAIENGKLNTNVRLIKTTSGLGSKLYYDYDFFSILDIPFEKRPTIVFDKKTQTISMPLVNVDGKVTKKFIKYKFTGKYFERLK